MVSDRGGGKNSEHEVKTKQEGGSITQKQEYRVNRDIRAPRVLVIDDTGKKLGVMLTRDAIKFAEERGLDLVEVGANLDPPVTKVMNYGKFMYQRQKQEKESRKKGAGQKQIKEIKLGIKTEEHDLQTKIKHIKRFLTTGHKAKVIVIYRGREMAHPELGKELLNRIIQEVGELGQPEYIPKQEGYNLVTIIAPYSKPRPASVEQMNKPVEGAALASNPRIAKQEEEKSG